MAAGSKPAAKTAAPAETAQATVAPANPAEVRQAQYADGTGWGLGQGAPEDRFVEIDAQGNDVGKPSAKPPAGKYARQVAVKGAPVTADQRRALGLDK